MPTKPRRIEHQRKIALVGTSCTGKTTIAKKLALDSRIAVVPEAARAYFTEHQTDPALRYSVEVQGAIQNLVAQYENQAARLPVPFVLCDRSVLDAVVYTKFGGDEAGAQQLYAKAQPMLPTYRRLLVLDPKDVPYRQDAVRVESAEARKALHEMYLGFLKAEGIPHDVVFGSLEERCQQVMTWFVDD